jgi:hypothetical protein
MNIPARTREGDSVADGTKTSGIKSTSKGNVVFASPTTLSRRPTHERGQGGRAAGSYREEPFTARVKMRATPPQLWILVQEYAHQTMTSLGNTIVGLSSVRTVSESTRYEF